jgi:tRNA threonylcarbamoyladenosine biosynthesis protein TsaB
MPSDEIWVDCGPGSFTGIRVGVAAARGLGFGWGVPLHGFSSMALIAASWFAHNDTHDVTVVIEGGHGEKFVQAFRANPLREATPLASVPADQVVIDGHCIANVIPDARDAVLLDGASLRPSPIYGRAPDAKPMA